MDLDDEVSARSVILSHCRSAPVEKEALVLHPQESYRGTLKNSGEPSVDPPLLFYYWYCRFFLISGIHFATIK